MPSGRTVSQRIDDLIALDKGGGAGLVPGLVKALKDRSVSIRTNAVQMIGRRRILELLPQVEKCLGDRSTLVRGRAAVCVGELLEGSRRPHLGLRKMLKDAYWVNRIEAIESLEMIEDLGAERDIAMLLVDEHGIVRSYCADAIVEMGGRKHLAKLRRALGSDVDDFARVGLMSALFKLGEREHLPKILELFGEEDYRLRCAVINNLKGLEFGDGERALVRKACKRFTAWSRPGQ